MPESILIIQTAFIGDVVLGTSLVENIHAQYPEASIDFLLRKGNEGLLKKHPYIREVLIWHKKEKKYKHLLTLLGSIRKKKYDRVINVQRYAATGFLTAFSGALETIGFDKNPLSFLFSKKIKHNFAGSEKLHETERNHRLISHFVQGKLMRPALHPTTQDEAVINRFIRPPFITISPASVWFTNNILFKNGRRSSTACPKAYTFI